MLVQTLDDYIQSLRIFYIVYVVLMRFLKLYLLSAFALFFLACSDDDDDSDYLFDREITEYSVLKECSPGVPEGTACFKIRYRYPISTDNYSGLCVWLDTTVVDSSTIYASSKQISKAHEGVDNAFFKEYKGSSNYFDTLDLTDKVAEFVKKGYNTLQVAMVCEYSDGGDPGSVQRVFLRFKDDEPPAIVEPLKDSVWATGVMLEWYRPTDRTDFYTPGFVSGKIFGYNIKLWAEDPDEDIRDLKVTVYTPDGVDNKGNKYYKRHARIRSSNRVVRVDSVSHGSKDKNYLRLVVMDGNGYDTLNANNNLFRLFIEGLRTQTLSKKFKYTVAISSWDAVGNRSGSEADEKTSVEAYQTIYTTDSIAPLMPTKIFTKEDSLFPGYAKLDSNNRLIIYWNRSVDPLRSKHGIKVDSVLSIPNGCNEGYCYDVVSNYIIEYYDKLGKSWNKYSYAGGSTRYKDRYNRDDKGNFKLKVGGDFVTDTIRWVAPGDTLLLRIRAVDSSKYYSVALVDSIFVSPGALAAKLNCPEGFIAVTASDSNSFCMERLEHRNKAGKFVTNVLHSEAMAACEAISAEGFEVSLCRERDWELVCLSGGSLSYGVIEEYGSEASDYLFRVCNVATGNESLASDITKRDPTCMNSMGVRDLPGQYQEWVRGRSDDTLAVLKGASYKKFNGLDRESIAYCTNRSFPFYTRPAYTQDTVYLYREGTKVDTVYAADTTRTLHKVLTKKDFRDTLQFYDVIDANGKVIGTDYSLYSEYKKGGKSWLDSLANGLTYKPSKKEAVFLTGEKTSYREVSSFYRSPTIGFRCCAYKK